ncbi:hypothetical protein [Burkholderia cepacia]|uniref:Uncharacterized protein n=1 Tax=Burkholderia cepacia TaxID=292 RepID=A0A8I1DQH9_BURCE|nr:hypothetical protein [Burkholderia cepacia]MBH9700885.1 hypothetical protein [Burkholderia cepacia]MBX3922201.1 hypothetical protein [Burkholderia cepacia]MBX3937686.1 hypothetical protein [Burkholderia cepacia]MBX3956194.1 hypothetical protein [Burkholderia cepacia]MBX3966433.1 hypothetical protein [Burkholderia cepacia]
MARDPRAAAAGSRKAGKKEKKMPCNTRRAIRLASIEGNRAPRRTRALSPHASKEISSRDPASERRREMTTDSGQLTAAAPVLGNACAAPALRQCLIRQG